MTVSSFYFGAANTVLILYIRNQRLSPTQSNKWNQVYKSRCIYAIYLPTDRLFLILLIKVKSINISKHDTEGNNLE